MRFLNSIRSPFSKVSSESSLKNGTRKGGRLHFDILTQYFFELNLRNKVARSYEVWSYDCSF